MWTPLQKLYYKCPFGWAALSKVEENRLFLVVLS